MSSAGQALGGAVGAIAGFIIGGPTGALYGAQLGMGVGGLLDPPKGPNLQGPRLSDLSQQVSTYGAPIPRVYGTVALYGNIIWLQNNQLTEVVTTTESGGKGSPEVTTTEYTYFASFAVALCRGPIVGVRRIWIGAELIYDVSSSDVHTIAASNRYAEGFTVYTGTDTQDPDALIQADRGVGDTPAYRGVAYIVFENYPLAKHGNSLLGAQVKVEVVQSGAVSGIELIAEYTFPYTKYHTSSSFLPKPYYISIDRVRFWSPNWNNSYPASSSWGLYDIINMACGDGVIITTAHSGSDIPPPGNSDNVNDKWQDDDEIFGANLGIAQTTGNFQVRDGAASGYSSFYASAYLYENGTLYTAAAAGFACTAIDPDGYIYVIGNSGVNVYDRSMSMIDSISYGFATMSASDARADVYNGYLWILSSPNAGTLYRMNISTNEIESIGVIPAFAVQYSGCGEFRILNGLLIQALPSYTDSTLRVRYIRISGLSESPVPLSDIVEAECLASNLLDASDIDVTDLTDDVRGYRVAGIGSIRSAIVPLQGVFPFDVVQSGYQIKFVPRANASVESIPEADLGASPGSVAALFQQSREMDSQMPRSVFVKYLDANREYDFGEQYAERLNTDAISRLDIDVPVVMTAAEAAQTAERLLYLYWLERSDIGPLTIPPGYRHLEPADVVAVTYDGVSHEIRMTSVNYRSDGCIECFGKLNSQTIYTSAAVADTGDTPTHTIAYSGPTLVQLLDLPALRDVDDATAFVAALGGYGSGWPGSVLYRSIDSGASWAAIAAHSATSAIGYGINAIGSTVFNEVDAASQLDVRIVTGVALSSVTLLQMLAGSNLFAYGADGRWEIIAAMSIADNGDGYYTLSGLLRGRYGTEWAASLHQQADVIVALNESTLSLIEADSSVIGSELLYRAVTTGEDISTGQQTEFTYSGVNLKPLSPIYLNGHRDPSTNDWTLHWVRRTRLYGAWRDYTDVPLGEASEAYEIEICNSGYTAVARTLTASAATVEYTSAQQVADFGSNQSTLYVRIYQISDRVGRGYPLQTSITR